MIAHIKGNLEDIYEDHVVVDVNGVGFNICVSASTIGMLPNIGNEVKLYTYTVVREDAFNLFGFLSREELDIFKKLITVNGIGPKGGLSILSVMSADDLRFAILSGDAKMISSAPGIGKKTAERVILDLKDKLTWTTDLVQNEINSSKLSNAQRYDKELLNEAVEALIALGYGAKEAHTAVSKVEVNDDSDVETVLKEALKYLL